MGVWCRVSASASRDSANAVVGLGLWASWTRIRDWLSSVTATTARSPVRVADDALGVFLAAEEDRLAVFEADHRLLGPFLVLQHLERAVVEDVAVLVDLHQRGAGVVGRRAQHAREVLAVGVHRAGDEGGFGAQGERDRVERRVQGTHRRRLGDLADLGGGAVLPLGEPVDPVVEQQDLQVDVAAQGVDEVVAADGQRVAVAGDDPDGQVAAGGREPCGDGGARPWMECIP